MYGHQHPYGGGRRSAQSPPQQPQAQPQQQQIQPQQQQILLNSNFFANPNLYHPLHNPNFSSQFNSYIRNLNAFLQIQQQFPNSNIPIQATNFDGNDNNQHPQQQGNGEKEMVERLEKAAASARSDLLALNENVSVWKVSQVALRNVKAESWESLGFQMQRVPLLNRLLATEGKINAFIHCFVAAKSITSLYDLEVAICKSEGIERFEELELGPLVRHPLAAHYFSVPSDATEVYKIRIEDIISYLCEFIHSRKKKEVKVDAFLDYILEKQSICSKEMLCIRIQNLGQYIRHIKKARQSEDKELKKCDDSLRILSKTKKSDTKYEKRSKKRKHISMLKKEMDDHFNEISERVKSFSTEASQFCGKHIRFISSSSDDEDDGCSKAGKYDNVQDENNKCMSLGSLPNAGLDRVSSCPYPSATEERKRLGIKNDVESSPHTSSGGVRFTVDSVPPPKKRKYKKSSSTTSVVKQSKEEKFSANKHQGPDHEGINGPVSAESLKMFVTTWKEACKVNNADEVLEKMLQYYEIKKKRKVRELFTSYPFVGLLYAAVTSIKHGTCSRHIYASHMHENSPQTMSEQGIDDSSAASRSINVRPTNKDLPASLPKIHAEKSVENIVKKISGYLEEDIMSYDDLSLKHRFSLLRRLCKCESWLKEQYSVENFDSLGYGDYSVFLETYMHLLPQALVKCIIGGRSENVLLEAHLLPIQLDVLLSQALDSLWENEIDKWSISELLSRQFPLVCFKLVNSDLVPSVLDSIRERRHNLTSNSVLFSAPLSRLPAQNRKGSDEHVFGSSRAIGEGLGTAVTTMDAIEVLLKAPMLIDLSLWSHWDILFAPYLGPIVHWLLKEVNNKDLMCLITKDGKVIRIDHSTTLDSFLKLFIRGSAFETAVALLSLCALYGGGQNVPLSLLKCHTRQGFKVIVDNYLEAELLKDKCTLLHGGPSSDLIGNKTSSSIVIDLPSNKRILDKVASFMSRFILECLSYLPIEFCSFAADVLISGLPSFLKDVPSAILNECKQVKQRIMLHEVGISLGLAEWIHDYHHFCSSAMEYNSYGSSCMDIVFSEFNTRSMLDQELVQRKEMVLAGEMGCEDTKAKQISGQADNAEALEDHQVSNIEQLSMIDDDDPDEVIESIRRDEFGLDNCSSAAENKMLEKQHARLGRALHCLSQELYSQDSHFLLELVQNADDNAYPESVEPTLTFILQEKGVIVLNNEQGFSANDIRALCDVGNSKKKDLNAGCIGKKGIGFKSVFRITDAPEIHSNGYHIKFDITKGQIGFVLPTAVPPCDVDLYTRWASADSGHIDRDMGNTCIVLPFRSNFLEGFSLSNILSMFSDLHPSLLLFLHRLKCIKFRNMLDDSLITMRKEVIGDGIVEVALGKDKLTWFVASRKLKAGVVSSDLQKTEISLAFTLQGPSEGYYLPILKQQPVFAFLPLRTYGLKFIFQGDFSLTSSREEVDASSSWNQWILSELPDLFVDAEKLFCDLPCYRESPGKAISIFMSFVPLVGEVHGFFSCLPRMIISRLRMSNCLILEGGEKEWVPPCKVFRNWTEQTRALLPDSLLHEHLGLGLLNKDVVLSDSLAKALGVEDYGPNILLKVMSSLCSSDNGLKSMGLSWLCSWLSAMYGFLSQSFMQAFQGLGTESNFITQLQRTPLIPLSDGRYSSQDEGPIWLQSEAVGQCMTDECLLKAFPKLYVKLRTVNPSLLASAASIEGSCSDTSIRENVINMLYKVGVQQLSLHDVVKVQILPAISDDKVAAGDEELMIEYLAFAMFHLQSNCSICSSERSSIIKKLHENALILTNYGYKRPVEVPIHFTQESGSSVDVNKLISGLGIKWHEIDSAYLNHPITKSMSGGLIKWRNFFQEIGVTDFVQVVQIEKSGPCTSFVNNNDVVDAKSLTSNSVFKDWVSEELFNLLSSLCSRDDGFKSKYLLEILDKLWDDCFSDKVNACYFDSNGDSKTCRSSFVSILQHLEWMASNLDSKLHYSKDLFHDRNEVHSLLGDSAPYAAPKVTSEKLIADIGLKTQVTHDDALYVLQLWRYESSFKASISQMSNFYAFLWKGMAHSKKKIMEELYAGPFIFVPTTSNNSNEDSVPGVLLSPHEVYWHDRIVAGDYVKLGQPECITSIHCNPCPKMLYKCYPNLHDFFVKECGVSENPPFRSYLQSLLQLSSSTLPHQAAKKVYKVFLMWDEALKCGSLSFEDVEYLKESLQKMECAVLPTRQDKWVSLHASFGLVCWCDDDKLVKEFRHRDGVDFLSFGESTDGQIQMLHAKVSTIMQRLGIPALSEVVSREAIYYGAADNSSVFSMLNWVLPYAQRYICGTYPDKYLQLKHSGFQSITGLKVFAVEKLSYRNIIKRSGSISGKKHECNCLLEGNILYCSKESDPHSIFLELSCLFNDGKPDLPFANFLHMITTMAESGSTQEQTEFFILNSQKVPQLPSEESRWSILENKGVAPLKSHSINSNWWPANWRTAPGFKSVDPLVLKSIRGNAAQGSSSTDEQLLLQSAAPLPSEISDEVDMEIDPPEDIPGVVLPDTALPSASLSNAPNIMVTSARSLALESNDLVGPNPVMYIPSNTNDREHSMAQQAVFTGRLGEHVAFNYFMGQEGETFVKWVNETHETGLPYDIVLGDDEDSREYVEVKSTISTRKNWFLISIREWQFAVEKGESFSIAHVVLSENNMAKVTVYKNPALLCQLGNLKLAMVVPKQ